MTITAVNPWFVFIPLIALAFAASAVGLWQWFTARVDWTLAVPAIALASCMLVLFGFAKELATAPTEAFVRLSDVQRVQENMTVEHTGPASAFAVTSLLAQREHHAQISPYSRSTFMVRPKTNSSPMAPIMIVRDADEPNRLTLYSLILLTVFAPALLGTTLLHVAPGHYFDILRHSLYVEQAFAPIGTDWRGSAPQGPHTVPSRLKEKTAVHENATDERKEHYEQRPRSTLNELEIEVAKSKGQIRPLTEVEIAEMKRPLYDRFVTN